MIAEIDGLRGIAILLVMVHRLWPRGGMNDIAEAGWVGVDLFFVISGFLITRILLDTRDDPHYFRNFYARRVLRIFPLYYLFVGTLLVAFPLLGSHAYLANAGSPAWYLTSLGNVPEGVLGRDPPYWLAPVWSLAIEEQFYLSFPLIVRWLDRRRLVHVLLGLFALAPLARAVLLVVAPDADRIQYLFTPCRTDAIAAGCLLALAMRWRGVTALRRPAVVVAGIAAAIAIATGLDRTTTYGRVAGYSVVAIGMAAIVLATLLARGEPATALLRLAPLRYLGRLCFGLYLLHRPADTLTTALLGKLGVDAEHVRFVPLKIAVAVVLASLSWRVIEQPMLRRKRKFAPTPRRTLRLVALVALVGCNAGVPMAAGARDAALARPDFASDAAAIASDAAPLTGKILYPETRTQSPITPEIAARLAAFARNDDRVFAKIGDSITAMTEFATCFHTGPYDLAGFSALGPTRDHFEHGNAAGSSPFSRASLAAMGGWTTADVLAGPLASELAAITPRYGVVLLGTNDDRYGRTVAAYGADLWTIVDDMSAAGVVPIVTTMPPIHSDPTTDARAVVFGRIARAIAQGRQVPLVDLYRELLPLPNQGIGSDGLHPTIAPDGTCILTASDLHYGFNVRNLVTLEALDRARAAVAGRAADATAPMMTGLGLATDPYRAALPLVDLADTRAGAPVADPCGAQRGIVYQVSLTTRATLEAYLVARGDLSVHVEAGNACLGAGATQIAVAVPAGVISIVVAGEDGEFLLVVQAE